MAIKGWVPKNQFGSDLMHLYNGHGDYSGVYFDILFYKHFLDEFDEHSQKLINSVKSSEVFKEVGYLNPYEENIAYNFKPLLFNSIFIAAFSYYEAKLFEIVTICERHLELTNITSFIKRKDQLKYSGILKYQNYLTEIVGVLIERRELEIEHFTKVRKLLIYQDREIRNKKKMLEELVADKNITATEYTTDGQFIMIIKKDFVLDFLNLVETNLRNIIFKIQKEKELMKYINLKK